MKINPLYKQENESLKAQLSAEKANFKEQKEAYESDMKELKSELAKDASEWDCEIIDNMSKCAQERKINMDLSKAEIEHLMACIKSLSLRISKYY